MNYNIKSIALFILVVFLTSCHKDSFSENIGETTLPSPEITLSVQGDVLGYVYDEQGNAVEGASVAILGGTTTTDEYGIFKFENVELNPNGTYVKVVKSGYILGSDMIYAAAGTKHTSRVHLYSLEGTKVFTSSTGGTIEVEGGGQVIFASNSIANMDGSSYSGEVQVTANRISTGDRLIADKMPGALVALDSEGRTVALGSMGMIAVELRDPSGNELNLKEGSTAEVTFPILQEQQNDAPSEILLWSFDEEVGIWKEEGVAEKSGTAYKASVSHFSFWNCDAPFPLTSICGKVLYENGEPAAQVQIQITTDGFGAGWGWTNGDGSFGGKIPMDQVMQIKIFNTLCDFEQSITEIEIGPFSNKTTLDDIVIPLPNEGTFSGIVACSGNPVPSAIVLYTFDGNTYVTESGQDGLFTVIINNACGDLSDLSVFAIDPSSGMASLTQTLDVNTDPNIELEVCNDCSFTVEIGGDPSVDPCMERVILATVTGNGNYDFLWSDGSSNETIQIVNGGQYCVTVTDTDLLCSMVLCSDESYFTPLAGGLESRASCDSEDGTIFPYFYGGSTPYTYTWSDPGIVVDPLDSLGIDVPVGTYSVTVTDANGCSIVSETTIEAASGFTAIIESVTECYGANLEVMVTGGQAPYSYIWGPGTQGQGETSYVWQSGNYCVDIYDANGCMVSQCVDVIIEDITSQVFLDITNCTGGLYTLTNNSIIDADLNLWYNNDNYNIPQGQSIDVDFVAGGFGNFWYSGFSPSLGCEFEGNNISLPYIANQDSLTNTYVVNQKTCPTCDDGSIILNDNYLNYSTFFGADAASIIVLDVDYNDVTTQASGSTLGSGTYYVVVTDSNTGCYIYSERILIN